MTMTLSKRQQARNESVLQELVHSVPGNDQCADCHARNPGMHLRLCSLISYNRLLTANLCHSLGIMERTIYFPLPKATCRPSPL